MQLKKKYYVFIYLLPADFTADVLKNETKKKYFNFHCMYFTFIVFCMYNITHNQ